MLKRLPIGDLKDRWTIRGSKAAVVIGIALFFALLATYLASPFRGSGDSRWSIATAMSFIRGDGGDLSAYMPPSPDYAPGSYALLKHGDHTYTMYPIGASLLAVPAVAVRVWIDPAFEAFVRQKVPDHFEKAIASFYGAIAVALFFWTIFVNFNDVRIAVATAVIFGLGTSMWSTATHALWQHGPLNLMLILAMLLLFYARRRAALAQYASIPLALSFIMRPTAAIPIAVLSAYVLICYRPWFVRFMLWAIYVAIPWMAFNIWTWGMVVPPYYLPGTAVSVGDNSTFGEALLGNLISPARGLFVFSPVLIFAISGFWLAMRTHEGRSLHIAFGFIIALVWILVSHLMPWWGGYSFGPRIMSDVLPFLTYFIAFPLQWCLSSYSPQRTVVAVCIAGLAAVSIFTHAQGALRVAPHQWNSDPDIDTHLARLWDWNDLQFARGYFYISGHPRYTYSLPFELSFTSTDNNRLEMPGWSTPEPHWIWNDGGRASIRIPLDPAPAGDVRVTLSGTAFVNERLSTQLIKINAGGQEIDSWSTVFPQQQIAREFIVKNDQIGKNGLLLDFLFPNATSPAELGLSGDSRQLSMALHSIRVDPK